MNKAERLAKMEADRKERHAVECARWQELTKGDWPESEHEQRFETLLKLAFLAPSYSRK